LGQGVIQQRFRPELRGLLRCFWREHRRGGFCSSEAIGFDFANKCVDFFAGLSTDGDPVVDAFDIHFHAGGFIVDHRIVEPDFFDGLTVGAGRVNP
jgi:hypothetical protein